MATLTQYRTIIKQTLTQISDISYGKLDIQAKTLFDGRTDRYAVITTGWDGRRKRIFQVAAQVDLTPEGKVYVQADNTDEEVSSLLIEKGIHKNDVVLAFLPEEVRKKV